MSQTIPGLPVASVISSVAKLWINDQSVNPSDESMSMLQLVGLLQNNTALHTGDSPFTLGTQMPSIFSILTSGNPFTFNLPMAVGSGLQVEIKKIDSDAGYVSIVPNSTDVIDANGNHPYILAYQYQSVKLTDVAVGYWEVSLSGKRTVVGINSGSYVINSSPDCEFFINSASAITLPAHPFTGQRLTFKNDGAYTAVISANSGQTIGVMGSASFSLYAADDYVTLEFGGTNWFVVATNGPVVTLNQSGDVTTTNLVGWVVVGNGTTIASLALGIYDIEADSTVYAAAQGPNLALALGILIAGVTTLVSNSRTEGQMNAGGYYPIHLGVKGYQLSVAGTIELLYDSSNTSNKIIGSGNDFSQITIRRIG